MPEGQSLLKFWGVCWSAFEAVLFKAASSVAFFVTLSELVPLNKHKLDGLQMEDPLVGDRKVNIFIRRSKTDQLGKGAWLILNSCEKFYICPVVLLRTYIGLRPRVK